MPFDNTDPEQQATPAKDTPPVTTSGQETPPNQPPADDTNRAFLIVGERAFRDQAAVSKHISSAQEHIATLEAERATDRAKITSLEADVARLQKIVDALDGRQPGKAAPTEQLSNAQLVEQAAALAVGTIRSNETETKRKANLLAVEGEAKAAYGDNYQTKVAEIAASLGMSLKAVDALGMDSPDGFRRLFLPAAPVPGAVPTRSSVTAPAANVKDQPTQGKSVFKMNERQRIADVASRMKAAGVEGY